MTTCIQNVHVNRHGRKQCMDMVAQKLHNDPEITLTSLPILGIIIVGKDWYNRIGVDF